MPLFCTLKSTYTGTKVPRIEKFENNGYPLLFEPVNKHLFYANPDDKTVNKFYCAPLSKGNGRLSSKTIDVSAGGLFDVQISTSVRDHVITDNVATIEINKETSVTSTGSLSANQNLTWGSNVNIPISIKTGGTNGHELSLNTGTLTMPANPNTDNHKATHSFIINETRNQSSELKEIVLTNTGSNGDGSPNNSHFFIESGSNVNITKSNDKQIKISATNTHTVSHGINCVDQQSDEVTVQLTNNGEYGNKTTDLLTIVGDGATSIGSPRPDILWISSKDSHAASHGASIDTTTANSPILQITNNGRNGTETTDLWTLKGSGATTVSASSNTVTINSTDTNTHTVSHGASINTSTANSPILQLTHNGSRGNFTTRLWTLKGSGATTVSASSNTVTINSTDTNTHTATHGASIDTTTANSPILQLTHNGSSGNSTTNLWTLKGSGSTTVSTSSNTVTISSTDTSVLTSPTTSTVYLSGKSRGDINTGGQEYINSSVYMNNGSLYSKHFYATTPNTSSWGTSVAAALDIKGNDSGSQTPIFRVTSNTYGNCQLEYCEKWGIMRLYRNGKYTEFPNWNIDGKIPMSTIHNQNAVNTLINDIRVVSALPSNASSYSNTLFLVTG